MWAYINALEGRLAVDQPVDRIASVASFFVSRVDTLVDSLIDAKLANMPNPSDRDTLERLKGKAAIANAKLAYGRFREIFDGERFRALAGRGARPQRPLWASTSTKNPAFRDVHYVEELIGPDTVNTLPQPTLQAFIDHGVVRRTIDAGLDEARATLAALAEVGVELDAVTRQLEEEGIAAFAASYDELIAGVEGKRQEMQQAIKG